MNLYPWNKPRQMFQHRGWDEPSQSMMTCMHSWGEPERSPHKREIRAVGLSVRTFMTRKYTRTVLIYGYLQLLIAAFKAGLVHWFVHQRSTNM